MHSAVVENPSVESPRFGDRFDMPKTCAGFKIQTGNKIFSRIRTSHPLSRTISLLLYVEAADFSSLIFVDQSYAFIFFVCAYWVLIPLLSGKGLISSKVVVLLKIAARE